MKENYICRICAEKESIKKSLFKLIIMDTATFCKTQRMEKEIVPTLWQTVS